MADTGLRFAAQGHPKEWGGLVLPFWLRHVRCVQQSGAGCGEYTTQERSCTLEEVPGLGGHRVWACREVQRHFRVCAGRPPEQTGYSVIETREPELPSPQASEPEGGQAGPLPSDAGQVLEELSRFASELKDSIRAGWLGGTDGDGGQGALPQKAGRLAPGNSTPEEGAPSSQILAQYVLPKQDV